MILTEIFYDLECNRCGRRYSDDGEERMMQSRSALVEYAESDGWWEFKDYIEGTLHFCPNCVNLDTSGDDDIATPKEKYPNILKIVIKFLLMRGISHHIEFDDHTDPNLYIFKCRIGTFRLINGMSQFPFTETDVNYIKNIDPRLTVEYTEVIERNTKPGEFYDLTITFPRTEKERIIRKGLSDGR